MFRLSVMKWIFFTASLYLLLTCCAKSFVTAQVVSHSEPMDEKLAAKIQFRVADGYVIVDGQSSTLSIDYAGGSLFNMSKETDVCKRFDISNTYQQDAFLAEQIKIFGEIKVVEGENNKSEKDYVDSGYKVVNAPRALLHRKVTAVRFEQFGIIFTPGATYYRVDQNHSGFEKLLKIAQQNGSKAGVFNPLIKQLDLTHLLWRFGGVPVSKRDKNGVAELFFSLESEQMLRDLLPPECRSL
ncbi:MAG: hypothetical protein ACI8ZB_005470 [Desulforhopalus sp.]|jgi:hypothetical protein